MKDFPYVQQYGRATRKIGADPLGVSATDLKNFSVLYRCVHCTQSFETVIQADYKSNAAARATPLLHSCAEFSNDNRRTQGIAHAFAIREL